MALRPRYHLRVRRIPGKGYVDVSGRHRIVFATSSLAAAKVFRFQVRFYILYHLFCVCPQVLVSGLTIMRKRKLHKPPSLRLSVPDVGFRLLQMKGNGPAHRFPSHFLVRSDSGLPVPRLILLEPGAPGWYGWPVPAGCLSLRTMRVGRPSRRFSSHFLVCSDAGVTVPTPDSDGVVISWPGLAVMLGGDRSEYVPVHFRE